MDLLLAKLKAALEDQYEVLDQIGQGGMAVVFRARDLRHDREVAIKVLSPDLSAVVGAARFQREISIAASLQHPHIMPVYDSGEADGLLYYVMPYAPDQTLRDLLDGEGQLSVDQAVRIACEVADALSFAHGHGVVHRDIKPGNILLSGDHAVVCDFGIARALHAVDPTQLTQTGLSLGTPTYMSPEQASGEHDLDGRSDLYSLACVTYEMLAGDPPFMASTQKALIARHIMEPPPSLEIVRPGVPPHVLAAVQKGLGKIPADRFKDAAEFKAALEGSISIRAPKARRRSSGAGWIAAFLAGVAFVVTGYLLLRPAFPELNSNRVVVFPLAESGFAGSGAGADVAIAIENALVYARPLEMASGVDWLASDAGAAVADPDARRIARDLGARYVVGGAVARRGDSVTVRLDLYDLELREETRERSTGLATDAGRVGIRAAVNLLPAILDPERSALADLSPLLERTPESIALWIQGEREYRSSHFSGALDLYTRSLEADSLLAFAAVKGALAASWEQDRELVLRLAEIGIANDALLPAPYAHFARGVAAYHEGQPDEAIEWLERARAEDPFWSEPYAVLGEVYFHLLPSDAPLDSLAEIHLAAAVQRDSSNAEPLFHLVQLAARRGDLDLAKKRYRPYLRAEPDPDVASELSLMLSCLEIGPVNTNWIPDGADVAPAFNAGAMFATGAWNPSCARAGLEHLLQAGPEDSGYESYAVFFLQGLDVATGRPDLALARLDSAHAAGFPAEIAYFIDQLAGVDVGDRAATASAGLREAFGESYEGLPRVTLLGLLGTWNLYHGDPGRAARLRERLEEMSVDGPEMAGDPVAALLAAAIRGHEHLLAADTAAAVAAFASLVPLIARNAVPYSYAEITPLARLRLAEIELGRGNYEAAWLAASVFDHPEPVHFVPFVRRSLEIRLEAARMLGRDDAASAIDGRLSSLVEGGS